MRDQPGTTRPTVHVFPDLDTLSRAVAAEVVTRARQAIETQGRFLLVLSGGTTPRRLYRLLGGEFRDRIPWEQVRLFWGDERYVPPDRPQSNYRMVKEALLEHAPIPAMNIHPMRTDHVHPEEAARAYEEELRMHISPTSRFDLVLLGLASDGHTASLFPGSRALDEASRWVVPVRVPAEPPQRLTLTFPALNRAEQVFFLAAGLAKAGALHRALVGTSDVHLAPATGVRPASGSVTWWVDNTAASMLPPALRSPLPT